MSATMRLKRALRLTLLRRLERRLGRERFCASVVSLRKLKRIVFVQQHHRLCDLLLSVPTLRAVRRAIPYAHITVVARSPQAAMLAQEDCVDEVISYPQGRADWLFACVRCFLEGLTRRFDLAIVLNSCCCSFTSDLMAMLSFARFILGSGHPVFEGCRENFFYNLLAPRSRRLKHQVERGLDIVHYIGVTPAGYHTNLTVTNDESNSAVEYLLERGVKYREFILGIHIDSGDTGRTWQIHRYVNVARHLSIKYGARIVVFWSGPGRERVQQFVDGLPFKPIEGSDLGLKEQLALISCCNVFVCCDLDMMHLAAAAGVPLVGLFGDLDPHQWKPIGNRYLALKGALDQCLAIDDSEVINAVEMLAELYPKSVETSQKEFDISEQVVDDYLGFGDISENIGGRF